MKNIVEIFVVIFILLTFSCASDPKVPTSKSDLPSFVLNPPTSTDIIYGIGYAKQSTEVLSVKVAEINAKADIASQIERAIQKATTIYAQEYAVDDNIQLISFVETITRWISDRTLSRTISKNREMMDDGGVWILMTLEKEIILNFVEVEAIKIEQDGEFKAAPFLEWLEYYFDNY